jgi:hypothetical protein
MQLADKEEIFFEESFPAGQMRRCRHFLGIRLDLSPEPLVQMPNSSKLFGVQLIISAVFMMNDSRAGILTSTIDVLSITLT